MRVPARNDTKTRNECMHIALYQSNRVGDRISGGNPAQSGVTASAAKTLCTIAFCNADSRSGRVIVTAPTSNYPDASLTFGPQGAHGKRMFNRMHKTGAF